MKIEIPAAQLLKPREVTFVFGIPGSAVRQWSVLRDRPEPIREPGSRRCRYRAGDIAAYLEAAGKPVPVAILPVSEQSEVG